MLTDKQLRGISSKSFREKLGITKTDYRLLRNLILAGWNLENWSLWIPGKGSNKELTLHEFCRFLKGIDVLYITRAQKERS